MIVSIHLISAIVLLFLVVGIILARTNKQLGSLMVISRILYLFLLVTGIRLAFFTFSEHPILTISKLLVALGLIGTIEVLGAHKGQATIGIRQILPVIILVITLGFMLH